MIFAHLGLGAEEHCGAAANVRHLMVQLFSANNWEKENVMIPSDESESPWSMLFDSGGRECTTYSMRLPIL